MIRGALILGIGFALGYTKAVQEQDDIVARYAELIDLLLKNERAQQTGQDVVKKDVVDSTAEETPNQTAEGDDADE